jgi:hypothetical protein
MIYYVSIVVYEKFQLTIVFCNPFVEICGIVTQLML